ncbi:MAG: response regulator transcription factor [Myxococcales bacterium]|nr:response regulator transcription factor [Myxococcales bacterium]MCB9751631.1 response regulator transcription factor [Myxococcales bacterium]
MSTPRFTSDLLRVYPPDRATPQAVWQDRRVRVLLVEDDTKLADRTAEYLRGHDFDVEVANDGELGLARALRGEHDIVLLDLMLPRKDGLEVCKELRQRSAVPVIMLTARGEEVDRILGLEIGADDYLPKPFSPRELVARIRAVMRRFETTRQPEPDDEDELRVGPLAIDRSRRRVAVGDAVCSLTAYQFDLLWVLASSRDHVLSREQLNARVRALRGEPAGDFDPSVDRSIDVHLSKIRQALTATDSAAKGLIRTIRGVGYVLSASS